MLCNYLYAVSMDDVANSEGKSRGTRGGKKKKSFDTGRVFSLFFLSTQKTICSFCERVFILFHKENEKKRNLKKKKKKKKEKKRKETKKTTINTALGSPRAEDLHHYINLIVSFFFFLSSFGGIFPSLSPS